ncbi:uncharacterized protein PAC_07566 [Phialocephala subalpina]|uniref:Uncharacterized protein n=1 Tax=Phialocephala subalpina TaxID=576137 RepID=A0A1L7WY22_9HELO|nr:uncharacterized protein PAC_07566 [Phialocephala subalpina]
MALIDGYSIEGITRTNSTYINEDFYHAHDEFSSLQYYAERMATSPYARSRQSWPRNFEASLTEISQSSDNEFGRSMATIGWMKRPKALPPTYHNGHENDQEIPPSAATNSNRNTNSFTLVTLIFEYIAKIFDCPKNTSPEPSDICYTSNSRRPCRGTANIANVYKQKEISRKKAERGRSSSTASFTYPYTRPRTWHAKQKSDGTE